MGGYPPALLRSVDLFNKKLLTKVDDGTERNGTDTKQNGFHDFTRKWPYFDKFGLPEAQILGISIFFGDLAFSIGTRPSNPKN